MTLISPKGLIDFSLLEKITKKPKLFAKDDGNFWQDPYVSEHLLNAHLDDESDQGSRKYQDIVQSVLWLSEYLKLPEDSKLLDLGCGPGLYSENFYGQGFAVTGIDFSQSSIDYAKEQAEEFNYRIKYICQDYMEMDYKEEFDVITLIYGDLCVLSHDDRTLLLQKVKKALKPRGYLIFDVFTKHYFENEEPEQSWYISKEDGFWSEEEHLLLQSHYKYKKDKVRLDKYTMILKNGEIRTHNLWKHYFSLERAITMMRESGFSVKDYWSDLQGNPFEENSRWIGMAVQKT
ncbi:class I SAM-dependent methyltransferase [Labilibaculum sp.]|uniref:class I SAM-dependent methyltransferase n=1 Tax=Labilibaculum sp. TaxID=2060723 RepID=UPI002AA8E695|nr:class I SAM-dependent methyltransferase [Labilibaculum sp.]MBN2595612.1 class I SAM-dependent methyltransferase [Marinifilaceae bacterium]